MHDPYTVAFDILYPWDYLRKFFSILLNKNNYYDPFVTIWHVDPEENGDEDSCKWFFGKLNENDKKIIKKLSENYSLRFLWNKIARTIDIGPTEYQKNQKYGEVYRTPSSLRLTPLPYPHFQDSAYTYEFIYNVFTQILYENNNRHYSLKRTNLNKKEKEFLNDLVYNMIDNLQNCICSPDGEFESVIRVCYKNWKRLHRPWYKHPKWHIHHWEIQIHFLNALKRKLFTKCQTCGKRFPYKFSPISNNWNYPKVKWYESEEGLSCGAEKLENCRLKKAPCKGFKNEI